LVNIASGKPISSQENSDKGDNSDRHGDGGSLVSLELDLLRDRRCFRLSPLRALESRLLIAAAFTAVMEVESCVGVIVIIDMTNHL